MEIYRGTVPTVYFDKPSATATVTPPTYSFEGATPVQTAAQPTDANGEWSAVLPYQATEGTMEVAWTFTIDGQTYTETDTYEVVTPILTTKEIKDIHPNATPEEIERIEKATRHIINAHTGQRFGLFIGTKTVTGNGTRALRLPERLLTLNAVNGQPPEGFFTIGADGWVLYHFPWGVPPVKADFFGLHMHPGGVIHNPNNVRFGDWLESQGYEVSGEWGWREVPAAVREAAKLLVNDYACADQSYRDRYLTSMTAADWRIQFHSGAFVGTGNVRADQLLSDYVLKQGWSVI